MSRLPNVGPVFVALLSAAVTAQAEGEVQTIDGRAFQGSFVVAANGEVTVRGESGDTVIGIEELVSFVPEGVRARNVRTEHRVWLRSGVDLPARRLSGRGPADGQPSTLLVGLPCGASIELPLSAVRAIRHGGLSRPQPALFERDLLEPPANEDVIYAIGGGKSQRSLVKLTAVRERSIDFVLRGDEYEFGLDGLAGVVFGENTGFAPDRQAGPRTSVILTTGEKLEGKLLEVGERVRCRLDEGCVLDVPVSSLRELRVSSDKLVWLNDLEPRVEQTPAFDRVWPWHNNRSVAGPGFLLGGHRYERGVGLVPRARLTYVIAGRFDVFEAVIGIDDRGGPAAHAIFRVYVDDKQMFESKPKVLGGAPSTVRVELNRAKTLSIEVDFGKNYDLGDFCAFADARLLQK